MATSILVLDNYDSFTYNLVQYLEELTEDKITVKRNDAITVDAVAAFDKIILSPGPGLPKESGILCDLIQTYASQKSILGICLGHQAIAEVFGGELYNLPRVSHGQEVEMEVLEPKNRLFESIPQTFAGGLYHSWAVKEESLPEDFVPTVKSKTGILMGISHTSHDLHGLQFHPESVLTPAGKTILKNWLS
ncbi:MAG: aminodeoxychorismate/anthranilate synthase component II [Bacteroidota bacterium]